MARGGESEPAASREWPKQCLPPSCSCPASNQMVIESATNCRRAVVRATVAEVGGDGGPEIVRLGHGQGQPGARLGTFAVRGQLRGPVARTTARASSPSASCSRSERPPAPGRRAKSRTVCSSRNRDWSSERALATWTRLRSTRLNRLSVTVSLGGSRGCVADALDGADGEASGEDRQAAQQGLLLRRQHVVAPGDRVPQRPVPRRRVGPTTGHVQRVRSSLAARSAGVSRRSQGATISTASGRPSSRRVMPATASAFSAVTANPGRWARTRSTSSRTESTRSRSDTDTGWSGLRHREQRYRVLLLAGKTAAARAR